MPTGDIALPSADPAKDILTPLGVSRDIKRAAWDAFQVEDQDQFETRLKALPLPQPAKRALWDAKYPAAPKTSTTEPAAPAVAQPSTRQILADKVGEFQIFPGITADTATGFLKKAGERISAGGDVLRNRFPILNKLPSIPINTTPKNEREQLGAKIEPFAEFALGGATSVGLTGAKALLMGAATTYGIAKSQGDEHAAATALISMVPGFLTLRSPAKWYAAAEQTMTKILQSSATAKSEEQVAKAAAKVLPLAMDRSLLRITKGRWAEAVRVAKDSAGADVKGVLASTVGDEPLPIQPILDELGQLKQKSMAIVPISRTTRAQVKAGISGANATAVPIEDTMVRIIDKMEGKLTAAAGDSGVIQARELAKFKRNWDRFVYKSKPFLDPTARTEFKKEAYLAGADAVRHVIATEPSVSVLDAVDKAFHVHNQLYSLIGDVGFKQPSLPMAFGWKHVAMKQLLKMAAASPSWRLASVKTKLAIADAITGGTAQQLQRLVTPIIAGTVATEPAAEGQ